MHVGLKGSASCDDDPIIYPPVAVLAQPPEAETEGEELELPDEAPGLTLRRSSSIRKKGRGPQFNLPNVQTP